MSKIFFCGDVHGSLRHIINVAKQHRPDAIILLGDVESPHPIEQELAPILEYTTVRFIHGNHDTDSLALYDNLQNSSVASWNLHGKVETIAGLRIAGLGGVFRGSIWYPPASPVFASYAEFCAAQNAKRPYRERHLPATQAMTSKERVHRSSIFYEDYLALSLQKADVLVTHEAFSCHPHGFKQLDILGREMGVQYGFHGHQHDRMDYSNQWPEIGFRTYGVGFRGITDLEGNIILPGKFD